MFDIFYQGENHFIQENFPFAERIDDLTHAKPQTKMFWFIEPNTKLLDQSVLEFRPGAHDHVYEHVWKFNEKSYGGLRLLPKADSQGIKYVNHVVCAKQYQILYTKTPGKHFDKNPHDKYVWCVDARYKIDTERLIWSPDEHEPDYIHTFHIRGQLEDIYPEQEGGIKLYPRNWKNADVKFHKHIDAGTKYPVLFVDDPEDYSQRDIYDDDYVWLIDCDYRVNQDSLDWVPERFDYSYIHCFKMPRQLTEKYPMAMGGIYLVPKDWKKSEVKIHADCPVEDENYDVFYTNKGFTANTFKHYAKRSETEWFWVIDRDYDFNGKLLYVPAAHEKQYIHVFKWGLEHKYSPDVTELWDNRVAGIYLVNKDFDITKQKLHTDVVPVHYDVFYTDDMENYEKFARRSRTEMFWMVDQEHHISDVFTYVPPEYDQEYIHIFKIKDQLDHKYPKDVTNVSDKRCGGVKLVPLDYQDAGKKFIPTQPTSNQIYPILLVENPDDYSVVTQDCWLIDKEYVIDRDVDWVPPDFQGEMIHTFHIKGQLDHKYPESVGGIRWVPKNWKDAEVVIHDTAPFTVTEFERFSSEAEGRDKSEHEWFWVIDPDVEVFSDFAFNYVPSSWDHGKTHVWQKLNPITGRQYDYGGVMLCPKQPKEKGRPKYIMEPACKQKPYPVLQLVGDSDILTQLEEFDSQCDNKMFWAVDPYTRISDDFEFDYYPSQWDEKNVHVFLSGAASSDEYKNVRLYPTGTFSNGHGHTLDTIHNNTFANVKFMNNVASLPPRWPDVTLVDMTRQELVHHITAHKQNNIPFFWTIDKDVQVDTDLLDQGFLPSTQNLLKVHMWQRINPKTGMVHSYGGLRLWPTDIDVDTITTDTVLLNKIKNVQYVRTPGSSYKPFEIVLISYQDPEAANKYEELKDRYGDIKWVDNVDGIFEAHKKAASLVNSKMFWVIDSDADVLEEFDFSYIPDQYDHEVVHVWNSMNPVTGLEYGYGGVKLFNTNQVLEATSWGLDFTTGLSTRFKVMPELSCITRFNTDAFNTWKSAFRECVKLSLKTDSDSRDRLEAWLNPVPDAEYSSEAQTGAQMGKQYGTQYANKPMRLGKINDYEWLSEYYTNNVVNLG